MPILNFENLQEKKTNKLINEKKPKIKRGEMKKINALGLLNITLTWRIKDFP